MEFLKLKKEEAKNAQRCLLILTHLYLIIYYFFKLNDFLKIHFFALLDFKFLKNLWYNF
jgi:hypothetical protein